MKRYVKAVTGGLDVWPEPSDDVGAYGKPITGDTITFRRFSRPDYTPAQCQQVADWLNGQDQPLPAINVGDYPGRKGRERLMLTSAQLRGYR